METHPAGADPTNLWGSGSHLIAAVNVALFFLLGYVYLGGSVSVLDVAEADAARLGARARAWFDPREGIAAMTRRDWLYAGAFTVASLVLCLILIRWPAEKIFDEIYYARAGEEYLKHLEIFEFTHPPLTKLLVTLSMLLFGGLNGLGDTGLGWRFLNVVVGALMVGVLYVFAKRLTGSTLFAAFAAGMLLFDGFHYVQSRIATPEITVAFFSLTTLYAFYRVWTASAARRATVPRVNAATIRIFVAFLIVGAFAGVGIATLLVNLGPHTRGPEMRPAAWVVAFLYVEVVFYLAARWAASRQPDVRTVASYADGSRVEFGERGAPAILAAEGAMGPAQRTFKPDGRMVYAAPAGTATFEPSGEMKAAGGSTSGNEMWRWIGAAGALGRCAGRLEVERPVRLFRRVAVRGGRRRAALRAPAGAVRQPVRHPARRARRRDAGRRRRDLHAVLHPVLHARPQLLGHGRAAERDVRLPRSPRGDASLRIVMVAVADPRAARSRISTTTSGPATMPTTPPPAASPRSWRCPTRSCGCSA